MICWNYSRLQERKLSIKQRYVVGGGTEPPFSGRTSNGVKYNTKRRGTYNCAVCDLPAYASSAKFKSGTGWPSFYEVITQHSNSVDWQMARGTLTAVE